MTTINQGVLDGVRRISGRFRDLVVDGGLPGAPLGFRMRGATQSGPPKTGTWKAGDEVRDRLGTVWICTSGGTGAAATWVGSVPSAKVKYLDAFGGDPTGASFSDTAMAAALAALGTGPGTIIATIGGTYKFNNSYSFGPEQSFLCPGGSIGACLIYYYGDSSFIHAYDPDFSTSNLSPLVSAGGTFTGFTVDGTNAGSAARGFELGDLNGPVADIGVQNFTGATAAGLWLNNNIGWTSAAKVTAWTDNCTTHILFDNNGGTYTFDCSDFTFVTCAQPDQNTITWQNNAVQVNGSFKLVSTSLGAASTNTGSVLNLTDAGSNSDGSGLRNVDLNIYMEADEGADGDYVGPVSINRATDGLLNCCTGQINIYSGSGSFQQSAGCYPGTWQFTFSGYLYCNVSGDALGNPGNSGGVALVVAGGMLRTEGYAGGSVIYNAQGDYFVTTLASGANTYAVNGLLGRPQTLTWHVAQPSSGSAATLTITGATTPAGSGVIPLSVANNAVDVIDIWSPDGSTLFAAARGTPFNKLALPAGSASNAPLNFTSGTLETIATAGAVEYDGVSSYITNDTTSGRGQNVVEQKFRLTGTGGTISTIANFFGSSSNISLVSGGEYEIEIDCWFLKTTAGTVTWTFANSAAPTSMNIEYKFSAAGGIVPTPAATNVFGDQYDITSATPTVVSASLTSAVNHHHKFWIRLINGTGTSLKIQATASVGTITPGINSAWKARRVPAANVGTFAA